MTTTFLSRFYGPSLGRDALAGIKTPPPRSSRHLPVPHIDLLQVLDESLGNHGFVIGREQVTTLGRGQEQLFGTLDIFQRSRLPQDFDERDIERIVSKSEQVFSIGFRSGNDGTASISLIVGRTVVVCSNGLFSGDAIVLKRRHTTGLRLQREVDLGVERAIEHQGRLDAQVDWLKNTEIKADRAKSLMVDACVGSHDVCAPRYLRHVHDRYFGVGGNSEQRHEDLTSRPDCAPRSLWGLHNAFTRTFRDEMDPAPRLLASARLGRMLGITTEIDESVRAESAEALAN